MRFLFAFAAAFVSALVVAFAILPFGLQASWAVPAALLCGALASGLGAWLAGGGHGRLLPVLASSLASLVVLAVPLGALLFFVVRTSLSISAPIVFFVVAAASAFAVRRRFRGPGRPTEGRAGPAKIVLAIGALAVVFLLLLPVGELGYTWLTSCVGEEREVFEEFPQHSPRTPEELDPRPDDPDALSALGSACVVTYSTPDVATEVMDYFEGRLRENGWEVLPPGTEGAAVYARRGSYEYRVSFSGDPTRTQGGTTPVTVIVRQP